MFITMTSDGERRSKREPGKMAAFKTRSQQKGTQMFPSGRVGGGKGGHLLIHLRQGKIIDSKKMIVAGCVGRGGWY